MLWFTTQISLYTERFAPTTVLMLDMSLHSYTPHILHILHSYTPYASHIWSCACTPTAQTALPERAFCYCPKNQTKLFWIYLNWFISLFIFILVHVLMCIIKKSPLFTINKTNNKEIKKTNKNISRHIHLSLYLLPVFIDPIYYNLIPLFNFWKVTGTFLKFEFASQKIF